MTMRWTMFALLAAKPLLAQAVPTLAGCWRADRPLGPGGGVESVERDAAYRTVVLQDSGRVALPLIPEREQSLWTERSYWGLRGDSVTLRVFTGLQGWDARLARTPGGRTLVGSARYLSDAIVVGAPPISVPVTLTRITCDASWPSVATNARPLRPWQRGEALYFERQVDRPAAIDPRLLSLRESWRSGRLNTTSPREYCARSRCCAFSPP